MAKVSFKRVESINDLNNVDIEDGNFIITGDGNAFIDYGSKRIPIGGTPDNQMDDSSTNSVQNKIIKKYIDDKTSANSKNIEELKESNIYSKEEKIVGKWIDGKPIYRNVFTGTVPNETEQWIDLRDLSNLKIDEVIKIDGTIKNTLNDKRVLPLNGYESDNYHCLFSYLENTQKLQIYHKGWIYINFGFVYVAILEYTKTTDEVSNE